MEQKIEEKKKDRDIRNSYLYKGILVFIMIISVMLAAFGGIGCLYLAESGLLANEDQTVNEMVDHVNQYYSFTAISDAVNGQEEIPSDTNFHYILYKGSKGDLSADVMKKYESGKLMRAGGNTEVIPSDANINTVVQSYGQGSTLTSGTTTEFGMLQPPYVYSHIEEGEVGIDHKAEKFGISEDKKTIYVYDGKKWYPLKEESEPQVILTAMTNMYDTDAPEEVSEYYGLDAVRVDWFANTYKVDEKDINYSYSFGIKEDEGGDFVLQESEFTKITSKANISEDKADVISRTSFMTYEPDETIIPYLVVSYFGQKEGNDLSKFYSKQNNGYSIDLDKNDYYSILAKQTSFFLGWKMPLILFVILGMMLAIASYALFIGAVGHHASAHPKTKEGNYIRSENGLGVIEKRGLDLIPMDIYALIVLFVLGTSLVVLNETGAWWIIGILFFLGLGFIVMFVFSISLAVNIKVGGLIKNTLCARVIRLIGRAFKKFASYINEGNSVSDLKKRAWIIYAVAFLLHFFAFVILSSESHADVAGLLFVLFIATWGSFAWVLSKCLAGLARIKEGAMLVAEGELSHKIDDNGLPTDLRQIADDINHIGSGLDAAVEERMKSDRMQTELITNVSHDIRTPLTSIVNYVDLLSKEELDNEKAKEYIEVLSRQALRLKKLISDLIDASKASSGTMKLNMERINASVLLSQAVGEYSEKLAAKNMNMVVEAADDDMYIKADPQRLWRVFDNLLGNTVKYGQEGTRAYVDVLKADDGKKINIIFRNISAAQLHITSDELMQRFVRGDESRTTEGSGLGLSIARSLTELMRGQFDLSIDGDLFKVTLTFNAE